MQFNGIPLGAFIFHVVENIDWLFTPLSFKQLDFMFYFSILTVIVGLYACYRLTRFYFELGSNEYLLLAYFCFALVLWTFQYEIWGFYLSPEMLYYLDQNPEFFKVYPELIIYRQPFWWIPVLLCIHAIRLRGWDSFNRPMQGLIIILLVELILAGPIQDIFLHGTQMQTQLICVYNLDFYESLWYLRLSLSSLVTIYSRYLDAVFIFIFVVYAYLTTTPDKTTLSVRISLIGWISFAVMQALWNFLISYDYIFRALTPWLPQTNVFLNNVMDFLQGFAIIVLMIVLLLAPEALLISKYQLFRATKLYAFVESIPDQTLEPSLPWTLLSYKTRVREYILSLPSDILTELRLDRTKKEAD